MENLTGGTPPVRYLPCVVPCKLYFLLVLSSQANMNTNLILSHLVLPKSNAYPIFTFPTWQYKQKPVYF